MIREQKFEAETLGNTLTGVNAEVLVDSLADTQAEVELLTVSEILLKVKALGQAS